MHELKIIQDIFPIIEKVSQENHLKSINKVFLRVGALRQIIKEFLQFAFVTIAKGTAAEGAELIIEIIPITIFCQACQQKSTVKENAYICPNCESTQLEILTGKEIILESIEGDMI